MPEAGQGSGPVLVAEALGRLHRAGWSLGIAAFGATDGSARIVWQVDGRNGENWIRADGGTEMEAWRGRWECRSVSVGSDGEDPRYALGGRPPDSWP